MRQRRVFTSIIGIYTIAIIVAAGFIVSFITVEGALFGSNNQEDVSNVAIDSHIDQFSALENDKNISEPVRLEIPSIALDAAIQKVGISARGNMAVPTNYTDAGWYKYGAKPGQRGNAVMDGHVDNGFGLPGVFKDLKSLKVGDVIKVTSADGTLYSFSVIEIKHYDYNDPSPREVFGTSTTSRLNLITCSGSWIKNAKTYTERLVITSELQNNSLSYSAI